MTLTLPLPFQIITHYGFSIYIVFALHLDICYIQILDKKFVFRKVRTTYNYIIREIKNLNIFRELFKNTLASVLTQLHFWAAAACILSV